MKALQDENATTSPRDMHKAKERKRAEGQDCEDLSNHRPCGETWLLRSLGQSGRRLDLSGCGGSLKEVVGKKSLGKSKEHKISWFYIHPVSDEDAQIPPLERGASHCIM